MLTKSPKNHNFWILSLLDHNLSWSSHSFFCSLPPTFPNSLVNRALGKDLSVFTLDMVICTKLISRALVWNHSGFLFTPVYPFNILIDTCFSPEPTFSSVSTPQSQITIKTFVSVYTISSSNFRTEFMALVIHWNL